MSDFDDDETTEEGDVTPSPADDGEPPADGPGPNDPPATPGPNDPPAEPGPNDPPAAKASPKDAPAADDDDGWDDEPVVRRRRPAADDDWDDDWDDDDRGTGGRRDLTIVFAIIAAAAVIVLAVVLTQKKSSNNNTTSPPGATSPGIITSTTAGSGGLCPGWPGALGGDGSVVSAGHGIYIWSGIIKGKDDGHGSTNAIHVRSNNSAPVIITVAAPDTIKVVSKGSATITPDSGTQLVMTLPAGDGTDGPDLNIDCAGTPATFTATAAGVPVPANQIKIGNSNTADNNPVSFKRGDP